MIQRQRMYYIAARSNRETIYATSWCLFGHHVVTVPSHWFRVNPDTVFVLTVGALAMMYAVALTSSMGA